MPHDFIREPDRNVYGKLKLLRQTTGKFVIYDPDAKVMGRWRQVIGNMLVRLAMKIGTTYGIE